MSSNPLVELVEKRVDSLQLLQLSGFDDLSPAFTAALQLCKALTSLYLSESNITLPEILAILEHLQLRVLHIPGMHEHISLKWLLTVDNSHQRTHAKLFVVGLVVLQHQGLEYFRCTADQRRLDSITGQRGCVATVLGRNRNPRLGHGAELPR